MSLSEQVNLKEEQSLREESFEVIEDQQLQLPTPKQSEVTHFTEKELTRKMMQEIQDSHKDKFEFMNYDDEFQI